MLFISEFHNVFTSTIIRSRYYLDLFFQSVYGICQPPFPGVVNRSDDILLSSSAQVMFFPGSFLSSDQLTMLLQSIMSPGQVALPAVMVFLPFPAVVIWSRDFSPVTKQFVFKTTLLMADLLPRLTLAAVKVAVKVTVKVAVKVSVNIGDSICDKRRRRAEVTNHGRCSVPRWQSCNVWTSVSVIRNSDETCNKAIKAASFEKSTTTVTDLWPWSTSCCWCKRVYIAFSF